MTRAKIQAIDSARREGNAPAILPVVEIISHRWLNGATERYLSAKYPGMTRERIEACVRYGMRRQIDALRAEVARLRMGQKAA